MFLLSHIVGVFQCLLVELCCVLVPCVMCIDLIVWYICERIVLLICRENSFSKCPVLCIEYFCFAILQHFFASFLSRDEAFRLIIDGWVQHSSYAKLFLHSQGSLASLAMVFLLITWLDHQGSFLFWEWSVQCGHRFFHHLWQLIWHCVKISSQWLYYSIVIVDSQTDGLVLGNRVHNLGHLEQNLEAFPRVLWQVLCWWRGLTQRETMRAGKFEIFICTNLNNLKCSRFFI